MHRQTSALTRGIIRIKIAIKLKLETVMAVDISKCLRKCFRIIRMYYSHSFSFHIFFNQTYIYLPVHIRLN